jgi:hypothetical protein
MHDVPVGHDTPQEPQLSRSDITLTQAPAHRALGVVHRDVHVPPLQTRPCGQTVPQAPQFEGSVWVSTQPPEHAESFEGHMHAPFTHRNPAPQSRPQPPQLRGSVDVATQLPPQGVVPDAHALEVQAPA